MITVLAFHFSDSVYGWMLGLTALQDVAIAVFVLSFCGRKGNG